ncbi:MAG: tRNA (N6-isopentenyl adenosine(37)-C2)-methylthiotransferase MiaB [Bacteroidota bacterium]
MNTSLCEVPALKNNLSNSGRKLYIESYGCQMNISDSEIVASIMTNNGFGLTDNYKEADLIFVNTCIIRENAEQRVRNRLKELNAVKKNNPGVIVGVLGCLAESLKSRLLEKEKLADIVAGPDAYRDLPNLIERVDDGKKAINVLLSREETYADINPVRLSSNGVTAFISIMRGCDNMCSFCVVPFTRGRERSRNPVSIISEVKDLYENGYREVTLLGQNVNSYKYKKTEESEDISFAHLIEKAALVHPDLRVRFSTSHPKDLTDEVLYIMKKYENICNHIHLPVQSGSSAVLERMNRDYTCEWYKDRIKAIRRIIPGCGISTDIITGFCFETEEDYKKTISLMEWVKFDFAYMFKYSERPKTPAARKYKDDIADEIKTKRLTEVIKLQQKHSLENNIKQTGKSQRVLIEGVSKRSDEHLYGRNTQNTVVVLPKDNLKPGQYVNVLVTGCTSATLFGGSVK